ncbi:MAG: hypothetical protein WD021_07750 [Rhodothermales bacterium]
MTTSEENGRRIFWIMAMFVVLGIPFVAVLWESLNHILALDFSARLWIALPAAAVLGGILFALSRTLDRDNS